MFGNGIYLAEMCSKADEYASDDREGIYVGMRAMLVCRVLAGRMLENADQTPDGRALSRQIDGRNYHSLLGDRESAVGSYREFIVYDEAQVLPEYVVVYLHKTS